ncbi:hypothetical protein IAU60_001954 [Kwoniella sp. DSM 27419]
MSSVPKLLANLPRLATATATATTPASSSAPVLIRPTGWPRTSFYLVTRHDLQYAPVAPAGPTTTEGAAQDEGELSVRGRVWGMKFWQGRPYPRSAPRIADPKIPKSSVDQWTLVDPSTLPSEVLERVRQGPGMVDARRKERKAGKAGKAGKAVKV